MNDPGMFVCDAEDLLNALPRRSNCSGYPDFEWETERLFMLLAVIGSELCQIKELLDERKT